MPSRFFDRLGRVGPRRRILLMARKFLPFFAALVFAALWPVADTYVSPAATGEPDAGRTFVAPPESPPRLRRENEPEPEGQWENYKGCGSTKGCFGTTFDNSRFQCVSFKNCRTLVTYFKTGDFFHLTLHGHKIASDHYIAFGLSTDTGMGDDLVFSCSANSAKTLRVGWNIPKTNVEAALKTNVKSTKTVLDSTITCKFVLPTKLTAVVNPNGTEAEFDLVATGYHLLLATGRMSGGNLTFHGRRNRVASYRLVHLSSVDVEDSAFKSNYIKAHGCLMVMAWIAFASIGTTTARFFRNTWPDMRPGDKALWFWVHQLCMMLAVVLSLIGWAAIIAYAGWFPYDADELWDNPHPAVGLTCIILATIQPVMAFFRPEDDGRWRWVFNYAHSFVGLSTYVLALMAISFGFQSSGLRDSLFHVFIGYVSMHAFIWLVLAFHDIYRAIKRPGRPDLGEKKFAGIFFFFFAETFALIFVAYIADA